MISTATPRGYGVLARLDGAARSDERARSVRNCPDAVSGYPVAGSYFDVQVLRIILAPLALPAPDAFEAHQF
ncbi:hypothetical protein [Kitasatospora mediocidica]|uniref:hypothetical protein n=1 Tax=Kitasatospora mediocidica TaxID=58352 RepID=UPI0018DB808B|nr:hypothetical protein [Kitasatospora mediocidica]